MKNLIQKLTEHTQILKEEYVEKTKVWAEGEYNEAIEMKSYDDVKWCEFFGLEPESHKWGRIGFPKGFYNTENAKSLRKIRDHIHSVTRHSLEDFIKLSEARAIKHYENSIVKLANRVIKKGLDVNDFEITSGRVGVNIEAIITDKNGLTVRCWTIVASGAVQKPHYRYLIK